METNTIVGLMKVVGTVPCDHPKCVAGVVTVRGCRFACPRCNTTGARPVYAPSGATITIQAVRSRTITRSEVLGDG